MEAMEVTVDFQQKSPLMQWIGSIDILKRVTQSDLGLMFNDGVLFFHLLRELFEEEIQGADELAEKILPSENYRERLLNWKIINENILEKLKIDKSSWYMEYLAKGNHEYIENILNAVREIAPVKPQKYEYESDVMTESRSSQSSNYWRKSEDRFSQSSNWRKSEDRYSQSSNWRNSEDRSSSQLSNWRNSETDYFNDILFNAKVAARRRRSRSRSREPSPFPRFKLAREHVIWGLPRYNDSVQQRPSTHSRRSTSPFQYKQPIVSPRNRNYRYYNRSQKQQMKRRRESSRYYYNDGFYDRKPPSVQTYCFMERQIMKRRNTRLQALKMRLGKRVNEDVKVSDDVNDRFKQLMEKYQSMPIFSKRRNITPQYRNYLYKYYEQFPRSCTYCTPLIAEEDEEELEEGELMD